jgi:hypothetical protein
MGARLYRGLVGLHPRAFRERFGAEMLCVYDEADRGERRHLLTDGIVSLARQWVARSGYWVAGVAVLGALLQFVLTGSAWVGGAKRALTGWLPDASASADSSGQAGVLLLGAGLVCAVLLLMTALASLVRNGARRRS